MESISVNDIIFVTFPFSDLSQSKLRPALVLANAKRNDWILCQITSQNYDDSQAIALYETDFEAGFLSKLSYIRPHKIFTAHTTLIKKKVACLSKTKHDQVIGAIQAILINGI